MAGTGMGQFWPQALALLGTIAAAVAIALYMFVPPAVIPASASATEFSAERAMEDVRVIADEPHPMGTEEHEEVADYIVSRLEEVGLSPQVQQTSSLRYDDEGFAGDQVHAGRLKNILARIPGTDNTGETVLLASHYDSMPTTPGAADGGVSTATLLETVRVIQAGPPPKNDVIVYVGDADVNGVLGPIAFHKHPWSRDTGIGFAFEGIGTSGPSALVYEAEGRGLPEQDLYPSLQKPERNTYPFSRNGWWLGQALEVLPRPLVVMPLNSTPFAAALSPELGLLQMGTEAAGLGFGQFRGSYAYHTLLDNPERLDPRSLQHQGENALSLTRHFGNLSLDRAKVNQSASFVAFNILPGRVVTYPLTWAMPLAVAIALIFTVLIVLGIWRGRLRPGGILLGVALLALSLVGTAEVDLPAPRLEVLDDTTNAGSRELRLRLSSLRGAPYAHLEMRNLPAEWTQANVDGEEIAVSQIPAEQRSNFAMTFYNLPEEGIEITLTLRSTGSIDATLTDYSNGLPDIPGMEIEQRPPEFMPAPYDFRDPTAVHKSFEL